MNLFKFVVTYVLFGIIAIMGAYELVTGNFITKREADERWVRIGGAIWIFTFALNLALIWMDLYSWRWMVLITLSVSAIVHHLAVANYRKTQ